VYASTACGGLRLPACPLWAVSRCCAQCAVRATVAYALVIVREHADHAACHVQHATWRKSHSIARLYVVCCMSHATYFMVYATCHALHVACCMMYVACRTAFVSCMLHALYLYPRCIPRSYVTALPRGRAQLVLTLWLDAICGNADFSRSSATNASACAPQLCFALLCDRPAVCIAAVRSQWFALSERYQPIASCDRALLKRIHAFAAALVPQCEGTRKKVCGCATGSNIQQ